MTLNIQQVLSQLDLGNAVAEFDEELERYFVETDPFRALVEDKADIIAGDKGTGKTALFQYLKRRYLQIPAYLMSKSSPGSILLAVPSFSGWSIPDRSPKGNNLPSGKPTFSRWWEAS